MLSFQARLEKERWQEEERRSTEPEPEPEPEPAVQDPEPEPEPEDVYSNTDDNFEPEDTYNTADDVAPAVQEEEESVYNETDTAGGDTGITAVALYDYQAGECPRSVDYYALYTSPVGIPFKYGSQYLMLV